MEEILKMIPYPDYYEFKKFVMDRTGWNDRQFRNRCNGRTKVSSMEIDGLRVLAREFCELQK